MKGASRKALSLLAYLAAAPSRRASRDRLAALLWENCDSSQARLNLRKCISLLRQAGTAGPDLPLVADGEFLELPSDRVEWDGDLLAGAGRAGQSAAETLAALDTLYRGDFLADLGLKGADEFESWARVERQRLRHLFLSQLSAIVADEDTDGDLRLRAALKLVAAEPFDEQAHRFVMTLLAERGQTSAAIRHYADLERRLRDELQTVPAPETREVLQEVKLRRTAQAAAIRSARPREASATAAVAPRPAAPPNVRPRQLRPALSLSLCLALTAAAPVAVASASGEPADNDVASRNGANPMFVAAVAHLESRDVGRVKTAAQLFGQIRAADPSNVEVQADYAEAMIFLGSLQAIPFETARREASEAVEEALAADPNSPDTYLANGMLNEFLVASYGNEFDAKAALFSLGKAAALRPDRRTLAAYGDALFHAENYAAAVPILEKAAQLDPHDIDAQIKLALATADTGRPADGLRRLAFIDRLYPRTADVQRAIAWILMDHGELARTIPVAKSAWDQGDLISACWLYTAYANLGMEREALRVLDSLPESQAGLAKVLKLTLQRRYGPAFDIVEAEIARTGNPMWVMSAVEFSTMLGRDDVAFRYVQRGAPDLLAPNPVVATRDVPMALSAAMSMMRSGHRDQGVRIVRSVLAGPMSDSHYIVPANHVWRSAAFALLGDRERALAEFEQAFRRGFRQRVHRDNFMAIEDYPMFASIRSDPRFTKVLSAIADANRKDALALAGQPAAVTRASLQLD